MLAIINAELVMKDHLIPEAVLFIDDGKIVLQKFEPTCTFCGSSRCLLTFSGKNVCHECVEKLSQV